MEMSMVDMYWFVKLDDIIGFLFRGGTFLLFAILVVGWVPFVYIFTGGNFKYLKTAIFSNAIILFIAILLLLSATLLPSTKQLAAIIVLPSIINNEQVQEIPNKLLGLSKAWLEELKPQKEEN